MQFVKLNAFQRIMRLWDQVHPYNAAQAFRLRGEPDFNRIDNAWRATLRAMGLGHAIVRGVEFCHMAFHNGDARASLQTPAPGTQLEMEVTVEHRHKRVAVRVVKKPFFNPERKRS